MTDFGNTIMNMANRPTVALENPLDVQGKLLSMQHMGQQVQQGQIQTQNMQQDQQDQATLRQLQMSGQFKDPSALADAASQAGVSPKSVMSMRMMGAEYQSKVATTAQAFATAAQRGGEAQKLKIDMAAKAAEDGRTLALTAKDPQTWQAGLAAIDQKYSALGMPSLSQKYGNFTPDNVNALAINGATTVDAHAAAFGQNMSTPAGIVNVKQPLAPGAAPVATQISSGVGPSEITKELQDYNNSLPGDQEVGVNDPGFIKWHNQMHPKAFMQPAPSGFGGGGMPGPGNGGPGPATPGQGPDLSSLPANVRGTIQALGEYRTPPSQALPRGKEKMAYVNALHQYYPGWNENDAEEAHKWIKGLADNSPSSVGGQVQTINNVGEHMGIMLDASQKIGGYDGVAGVANGAIMAGKRATKDVDLINWDNGVKYLQGEGAKLIKAGLTTEGELNSMLHDLDAAKGPAGRAAALWTAADFMMGKIRTFELRNQQIMGNQAPVDSQTGRPLGLMTPLAQQNFARAFQVAGKEAPQFNPPASPLGNTRTAVANRWNPGTVQPAGQPTAPAQPQAQAPQVPNLTNFHTNPQTGQRIGQNASGAWVDAATGKPVQ